jgi:outer membrane protein OmpA-like peptidoglycan-associated protein
MSAGKKVFLFLILLVLLIVYTVTTFEYKTILNGTDAEKNIAKVEVVKVSEVEKVEKTSEDSDSLLMQVNSFKDNLLKEFDLFQDDVLNDSKKPIDLELIKKDGVILMNGTFKDEEQSKSIADLLNINRDGEYTYEDNRVKDVVLLNKLSLLINPFKEFFANDAKLILKDGSVELSGDLKDSNSKALIDSVIAKSNLKIATNITGEKLSITDKTIENMKAGNLEKDIPLVDDIKVINTDMSAVAKSLETSISEISNKNKITFKRRSTTITENSFSTVKEIAELLKKNPTLKVEVGGHTDSRGRKSLNKRISQDRANSVKDALIKLGVDSKRLSAVGYGEAFPIAKDDADGLSEVNRRVEFVIGDKK